MKARFILFAILLPYLLTGQVNLLPNPGFEDSIACQNTVGTYRPANWYSPTGGSPDYYVFSSIGNDGCFDPLQYSWGGGSFNNMRGYQPPHIGKGYIGFGLGSTEFIAVRLTDTLLEGKKYEVSFYCSLAEASGAGMDRLNFSFMQDSVTGYSNLQTFLDSLENEAGNAAGNCLVDTSAWVLVRDTFIASGGELYLVFGDMNMGQETYCTIDSTLPQGSYYYFDDFDVHCIDCTADTFEPPTYPEFSLTPSPTSGEITLSGNFPGDTQFEVFNTLGQRVYYNEIPGGNNSQTIILTLADGTYLYRIHSAGVTLKSGKLVLTR